ncbi:hypothetical protein I9W82_000047 [Candida metapsilosis]|uniref:F-box domain-containing protein n=1 Tax=Candida metapsilosis TaxID=273372 RepID=A0A8H7ZFB4_9ASCO|nr:hypothetical protein I9W82_000047 [Candida metapsilosis]
MISLPDLPFHCLQTIFSGINQHQTLALAPLHSSFYEVAKTKLYKNIYVYQSWAPLDDIDLYDFENFPKPPGPQFRYHKDINNLKSNKFTIISVETLERYLAHMDKTQTIYRLEMDQFYLTLMECIFRLLHIKFLVLRQNTICCPQRVDIVMYQDVELNLELGGIEVFKSNQRWLVPTKVSNVELPPGRTWLPFIEYYTHSPADSTTPTSYHFVIDVDSVDLSNLFKDVNVSKLNINSEDLYIPFYFCNIFNTEILQELTIVGYFLFCNLFEEYDLTRKFPKLKSLCLRVYGLVQPDKIMTSLPQYSHKTLEMFTVSTVDYSIDYANILCNMGANFPAASINWWRESASGIQHRDFDENIVALSPNLPLGIVGDHHPGETTFRCSNQVTGKLQKYYTNAELSQIYSLVRYPIPGGSVFE